MTRALLYWLVPFGRVGLRDHILPHLRLDKAHADLIFFSAG
jgi:hypothetical protein